MISLENAGRFCPEPSFSRAPSRPVTDPLAFAREANAAYLRWRGPNIPSTWRQRSSELGVTFCRGDLLVVGALEPRDARGARAVTVSVSRLTGGAPTEADVQSVMADFLAEAPTRWEHRGGITYLHGRVPALR